MEYTAPQDRTIAVFDMPEGKHFMYKPESLTSGESEVIAFEIEKNQLKNFKEIMINFYNTAIVQIPLIQKLPLLNLQS